MYATPNLTHPAREALIEIASALVKGGPVEFSEVTRRFRELPEATIRTGEFSAKANGVVNPILPPNEYFRDETSPDDHIPFSPVIYLSGGSRDDSYDVAIRGSHAARVYHQMLEIIHLTEAEMLAEAQALVSADQLVVVKNQAGVLEMKNVVSEPGAFAIRLQYDRSDASKAPDCQVFLAKGGHSFDLNGEQALRLFLPFIRNRVA
ncbi:MAG: hypothetical protein KDD64_15755 [Bdellovibrionales bacterium]|nr:hypothetical protein [Bdellovibrionales bacterium]